MLETWRRCGAAAAATLVLAAGAAAEPPPEAELPYMDTDCATDVQEHCTTVGNGSRAVFQCLGFWKKQGALTPACNEHYESVRAERQAALRKRRAAYMDACREDIAQHCAQFEKKQIALIGCLERSSEQLSEQCNAIRPRRARYQGEANVRWRDGSETLAFERELAERQRRRREMLEDYRMKRIGSRVAIERQRKAEELIEEHRERMDATGEDASGAADAEPGAGEDGAGDGAP